jgi:hypothetical protein
VSDTNYSFPIIIKSGSRRYHLIVEQVYIGDTVERYKVMAKDNQDKYIVLENNRPLIRKKYLLKKKALSWKVKIGSPNNVFALEEVIRQIEYNIDPPERSPHPKNS